MPKQVLVKTEIDYQIQFLDAFGMKRYDCDQQADADTINLWKRLIKEEVEELNGAVNDLLEAWSWHHMTHVAKELADVKVVVNGLAVSLGIPLDDVYAIVHASNMAKLGKDGQPNRREDGKILKPEGWVPPEADIENLFKMIVQYKQQLQQQQQQGAANEPTAA